MLSSTGLDDTERNTKISDVNATTKRRGGETNVDLDSSLVRSDSELDSRSRAVDFEL